MSDDGFDPAAIEPAAGYDTLGEFAAEVARLAGLPPHEYDRVRRSEAQRLGVRVGTLDKAVQAARPREAADEGQGEAVDLDDPEPWPDPVDGAVLLDEIEAFLDDHLALSPHAAAKLALWIVLTYAFEAFHVAPRLAITSAIKRCGKTTVVDVLAALCSRAVTADSLTAAATFRVVAIAKPTLLIDEADTFLKDNEELRGILNSGHKATGSVIRAVEANGEWVPRRFRTFSPCAIAMIGRLPGTLEDRAILVQMKRALRGEMRRSFRPDHREVPDRIRSQAARFAADNTAKLIAAEPQLPAGAFNRFADNWRPLAAVADLAGGRWPGLARAAILADLGGAEEDELGQQLLEDIRAIFAQHGDPDALSSFEICTRLHEMADRPWKEFGRNEREISPNKLARLLKPFGINPAGTVRLHDATAKGYKREAFVEAWDRYLPPEGANQTDTPSQATDSAASSDFRSVTNSPDATLRNRRKPKESAGCDGVTVGKGGRGPRGTKGTGQTIVRAPTAASRST